MPKYNLNVVLQNIKGQDLVTLDDPKINEETGEPLVDGEGNMLPQERIKLTAAVAVVKALVQDSQLNLQDDSATKASKYRIAKKVQAAVDAGEDVVLNAQEIEVVKKAIGQLWGVMTVGAIDVILEG